MKLLTMSACGWLFFSATKTVSLGERGCRKISLSVPGVWLVQIGGYRSMHSLRQSTKQNEVVFTFTDVAMRPIFFETNHRVGTSLKRLFFICVNQDTCSPDI
jgi:hypothetical protein